MHKRVTLGGAFFAAWIAAALPAAEGRPPRIGDPAPEISGTTWINSAALERSDFRGRVVLVEFWTYG